MASYFTVNIALHFLFNWKIEKSKFFNFRFSSSSDGVRVGGKISSIISRTPFLKQFSRTSVTPDRTAAAAVAARGELNRCKSEEKSASAKAASRLHLVVPLPQKSVKTDPYIILNDTQRNDPVVRGSSILLIKELSESSLDGSGKIAIAKTRTSGGGGTLNSLLSNDNYQILFGQSDHMRSDSYEEKPHLDILSPRSRANMYAEVRQSRK